ncbi:MAG: lysophospholipid acyltransferase family protein [Gammaproteobacteria bacterium]|jgi:KDO2-lipid IV(A) lauroyltransferase|tara:strand:+ start:4041 stop:4898 length:858 start_codon:yes stop_codon:yes gene_type:complete
MKLLFYLITLIPIDFIRSAINLYTKLNLYKSSSVYKLTMCNIKICFPDLSDVEKTLLAKESFIETFVSGYETLQSWARPIHISGKKIFRIENNYLISQNANKKGLAIIAIHNRSVDMLLKWINSKTNTTTLYKKVKIKYLDKFVRKQREENNNEVYETNINGVRKIFKAFIDNKVVCLAADQVPKRGMGEYIKFFNTDAYTTTLAASMVYKTKKPAVFICMNSFENNRLGITIYPSNESIYNDSEYKLSINQSIEDLIKINPKDYSWEYKRFRRSPSGIDPYVGI